MQQAGLSVLISTRSDLILDGCVKLDIFSQFEIRSVLQSFLPDVVINCSWITEHASYLTSSKNQDYRNATVNLFHECQKIGVGHFIGVGSAAEYVNDFVSDSVNLDKQLSTTKYAKSKRDTLSDILNLHQDNLITFNWLRVFQAYGPSQDPNRFLPSLINSLRNELPISIQAPNVVRDWITTRDIASAVLHLIKLKISGTVDIGSTNGVSNLEIYQKIVDMIKPRNLKFAISKNQDQSALIASKDNILFETGWTSQDDLSSGINWILKGN